ncbi:MAG: L,D-transpeptidase [Bdellovibrionota bacterium]
MRGNGLRTYLGTAVALCAGAFAFVSQAQDNPADLKLLESGNFYIYVDKAANQLSLRTLDFPSRKLKEYRAISGLNAGDKESEGDRKTPEGIYFVEGFVPKSKLIARLHGPAGAALNYPNPVDHINSQTGSGIWIHGVESEQRLDKRFDTRGCVAMGNPQVLELMQWLKPKHTVVVVVDESSKMNPLGLVDPEGPAGKRVHEWAAAWSSQNTDRYLDFYHDDLYSRGMTLPKWRAYKAMLNKRYKFIKVSVRNLRVFKHSKYWVSVFEQVYESDLYQARSMKRLYWVGPEDNLKILAEESFDARQGPPGSFSLDGTLSLLGP